MGSLSGCKKGPATSGRARAPRAVLFLLERRGGSPSLGQHVADLTMTGNHAQCRTLDAASVAVVDPALDPGETTSLVLSWVTAYQLLQRDARVHEGQTLLVIGAAGAVGQALVVLGKRAGCGVWGSARGRSDRRGAALASRRDRRLASLHAHPYRRRSHVS